MHRREIGDEAHDAQRTEDRQTADDGRQAGRHHPTEDKEQQHGHQRNRGDLGTLLVDADGPGELIGQWVEPGQLDVAVVDLFQVGCDVLVVLQDLVVVVALEWNADERLPHVLGFHLGDRGVGAVRSS